MQAEHGIDNGYRDSTEFRQGFVTELHMRQITVDWVIHENLWEEGSELGLRMGGHFREAGILWFIYSNVSDAVHVLGADKQ